MEKIIEDIWYIEEAMIRYGGGFVSKLGMLCRESPYDYKQQLINLFYHYFVEYHTYKHKVQVALKFEELYK